MGRVVFRRLWVVLGYGLYGTGILLLLLWGLFPRESARLFVEEQLGRIWPELHWRVGGVSVEMPPSLLVRTVEGYGQGEEKTPLVRMEKLSLRPHALASIGSWCWQAGYRLTVGKGNVAGLVRWHGGGEGGRIEGVIEDIALTDIPLASRRLGRTVQGSVSGRFVAAIRPASATGVELEGQIDVANGRLGLQRPILKHAEIPFAKVSATVKGQGMAWTLAQGKVASDLFDGQFTGSLALSGDSARRQIDVQGVVQPKPPFFKGLENTVNLQALRMHLKENALPFRISGELTSPGIHYGELAVLVHNVEKELK